MLVGQSPKDARSKQVTCSTAMTSSTRVHMTSSARVHMTSSTSACDQQNTCYDNGSELVVAAQLYKGSNQLCKHDMCCAHLGRRHC